MKFTIISKKDDIASRNIAEKIIEYKKLDKIDYNKYKKDNLVLVFLDEDLLEMNELNYDTDIYIFIYHHRSQKPNPCLTVHVTGNLTGKIMHGGNPDEVSYAEPSVMGEALRFMQKEKPEDFAVSYEATHHGPTNWKKPIMFLEIGSNEEHWGNMKAADAIAKTVVHLVNCKEFNQEKNAVGIGGNHYADRFTRRALKEEYNFGHIIPEYAFPDIKKETILQIIEKTHSLKFAVLDTSFQGKKEDRDKILKVFEGKGVKIVKLK